MPRVPRLIAVVLLSLSLGLHWTVVQSVAWAGMIVSRSQDDGLATALRTTFDGQHPCKLCKAVAAGKAAERKAPSTLAKKPLDGLRVPAVAFVVAAPTVESLDVASVPVAGRAAESPVPPPPRA